MIRKKLLEAPVQNFHILHFFPKKYISGKTLSDIFQIFWRNIILHELRDHGLSLPDIPRALHFSPQHMQFILFFLGHPL